MRIVQIVRYTEASANPAVGTVALGENGKLYRLVDGGGVAAEWAEMDVPPLPSTTLTLKPKAK